MRDRLWILAFLLVLCVFSWMDGYTEGKEGLQVAMWQAHKVAEEAGE